MGLRSNTADGTEAGTEVSLWQFCSPFSIYSNFTFYLDHDLSPSLFVRTARDLGKELAGGHVPTPMNLILLDNKSRWLGNCCKRNKDKRDYNFWTLEQKSDY